MARTPKSPAEATNATDAAETRSAQPASSARRSVERTPPAIRTTGIETSPALRDYIRKRLGTKLGKFANYIESITVRLEDANGPRGGIDKNCRIKVVLRGLEPVIVEKLTTETYEAVDVTATSVERAVRRTIGNAQRRELNVARAGKRAPTTKPDPAPVPAPEKTRRAKRRALPMPEDGSLIGRRVGRAEGNVSKALERPDKKRRDATVDTSLPGWSATDRKAGGSSTARRNSKKSTERASATLEDSATGRPSRKSTRKSANHARQDNSLHLRETRGLSSPQSRAKRGTTTRR